MKNPQHSTRAVSRAANLLAAIVTVTGLAAALDACTPGQRQAARSVLDAATVACVVANATLTDAEVARVCGIVDRLDGPLRDVLQASREQVATARARGEIVGALRCISEAP